MSFRFGKIRITIYFLVILVALLFFLPRGHRTRVVPQEAAQIAAPAPAISTPAVKAPVTEQVFRHPEVVALLNQSPLNSLTEGKAVTGQGVQSIRFQHYYDGIEVLGSVVIHHQGPGGERLQVRLATFDLDPRPTISDEDAVRLAKASAGEGRLKEPPVLKILPAQDRKSARLIYLIKIIAGGFGSQHEVMINAHTGQLIADTENP